jgi:chromate transport protein ChrA
VRYLISCQYQELFAVCQSLPGPASTKLVFCITLHHAGVIPAVWAFLLWSLPGALGMYGLSVGVQLIGETLPVPVYALLSGLNASTVGIIALAAVQLAEKAIRDRHTRILVIFGACAGMCYNALWFFPALMAAGGISAVLWYGGLAAKTRQARRWLSSWRQSNTVSNDPERHQDSVVLEERTGSSAIERNFSSITLAPAQASSSDNNQQSADKNVVFAQQENIKVYTVGLKAGVTLMILFFTSFLAIMLARALLKPPPLEFGLFANMYLAGTIILGGGPVVIPLLRSYVVDPGWVSGRDFLIGLAIIQAFPGPNFNFAVYLGSLSLRQAGFSTVLGAFLGYVGIFLPGLMLGVTAQSFWRLLRRKKWVEDLLRGLHATAVGLVFTAVYRLWEIGYLTPMNVNGQSLGNDAWWVVVAAVTYSGSAWFRVPTALAILVGGLMGVCWYFAVGRGS